MLARLPTDEWMRSSWWAWTLPLDKAVRVLEDPARVESLLRTLGPEEEEMFRYILSQAGLESEENILKRFPHGSGVLRKLKSSYLVFENTALSRQENTRIFCVPRDFARFITLYPDERTSLANLLRQQSADYLGKLAVSYGLGPGSREALLFRMRKKLLDVQFLRRMIEELPEKERKLFQFIAESGGAVKLAQLKGLGWPELPGTPLGIMSSAPIRGLFKKALCFPDMSGNATSLVVPSDLLITFQGKKPGPEVIISGTMPAFTRAWGFRLLTDLRLLAAFNASGRLVHTQKNLPDKRLLSDFLKALGVREENYGIFLSMMLETVEEKPGRAATAVLEGSPSLALRILTRQWQETTVWSECFTWRHAGRSARSTGDEAAPSRRMVVMRALEKLPGREWVEYGEFLKWLDRSGWRNSVTGRNGRMAVFVARISSESLTRLDAMQSLNAIISESLVWLGFVELGYAQEPKAKTPVTHIRLTDWGRAYLDKKTESAALPDAPVESTFKVLTNHDIAIPPHLDPRILSRLFRFASLKSTYSFSLSKGSLRSAFDENITLDEIVNFLKNHSQTGVPENVLLFIREVGQKHGHIKIGRAGLYVEVQDPMLLLEIKSRKEFRHSVIRQVGERVLLIDEDSPQRLARILKKLGYMPVIESPGHELDVPEGS